VQPHLDPYDRRPRPRTATQATGLAEKLRDPKLFIPALVVGVLLIGVFAIQPGGEQQVKEPARAVRSEPTAPAAPAATQTPATQPSQVASPAVSSAGDGRQDGTQPGSGQVAGARATPSAITVAAQTTPADPGPDLSRQSGECGAIREVTVPLSVEQNIGGVAVRATRAAVYPIDYLRCILLATGGRDATSLSLTIGKAEQEAGATHAVLIDLWMTNSGREFGQLNLKSAQVAAAGATFSPLATLNGRADVVVSAGQGRSVTLVVGVKHSIGGNTGPMTLMLEAPMFNGKPVPGKYQLFLPTP
jgi:hypothetical protein